MKSEMSIKGKYISILLTYYYKEGLSWLTDYHILQNKRYVLTNDSQKKPRLWSLETCK